MANALINLPKTAKRGAVIEIKTLVQHPMETGYRHSEGGMVMARDIIEKFVCTYNGVEIFSAELFPAVAANPFLSFTTTAMESGTFTFTWVDNAGRAQVETASIKVE